MSRLRNILSQPPGYESLSQANVESLSQINAANFPSLLFAIAGATRLLTDRFIAGEPNDGEWQDRLAETVIPAMIRLLDTDDPNASDAARLAALDDLATVCEQALGRR